MSGFNSVVASPRLSYAQLVAPEMMMRPLTWDEWFLRQMILHRDSMVDAAREAETLARNAANPKCAVNMAVHRGKDSYGWRSLPARIVDLSEDL